MVSLKSLFAVGGFTFLSRILGLVRDQFIAAYVGAGTVADAFVLAFRVPNMFRRIFAEGAFSSAFVPVYSRVKTEAGESEAQRFARNALGAMLVTVLPLCGLMIWGMPQVMGFLASQSKDPAMVDLATNFGRIMFCYLAAMALLALFSGVLQSHGKFSAAAAAPTMLNVVMIVALITVLPFVGMPGYVLSWSVAVAGVFQVLVVVWGLRRLGLKVLMPSFGWSKDLGKMLWLMGPGLISAGVWQINTLVHSIIAASEQSALSYLYFSDRLYQLPLGLIGVAFGVVLLPSLTQSLRGGRPEEAHSAMNRGIEFAMLITLPSAIAMMVIPLPLCVALFEYGMFSRTDATATANTLFMLGIGVPASVLSKVFMPGFYAREDTKTPMYHAVVAVIISAGLGWYLFQSMSYIGLALAISVSMWGMTALQATTMLRWGYWQPDTRLISKLIRITIASLAMGLVLYLAQAFGSSFLFDGSQLESVLGMLILVMIGALAYGISAFAVRAARVSELKAAFRPNPAAAKTDA